MDMEEVYLRQITEYLKRQNQLQEDNNALLHDLLQKLSNWRGIIHEKLILTFVMSLSVSKIAATDDKENWENPILQRAQVKDCKAFWFLTIYILIN